MKPKFLVLILLIAGLSTNTFSQKKKKNKKDAKETEVVVVDTIKLKTPIDSVSYSLGVMFGSNLAQAGFDTINNNLMVLGIEDVIGKKKFILTTEQANQILNTYVVTKHNEKAQKNLAEGQAFLEKNKQDTSVVVLPSGLQYKILVKGNGEKPTLEDKVTVNYHGTLIDGKVFDSSVERGEPIQLNVNAVIEGWKEALQLMPVGSKWKLFVPANLGYGENPRGGSIEPNSVLVFEVELISISKENK